VRPGALFFALHGQADGNKIIEDALKRARWPLRAKSKLRGAIPAGVARIQVRKKRARRGDHCGRFPWASRERAGKLVAVTGTNGKTTITSVMDAIVKASGAKTACSDDRLTHTARGLSSAKYDAGSVDLQDFAEIRDAGERTGARSQLAFAVMELALGMSFSSPAVFTNLTREHMIPQTFEIISPQKSGSSKAGAGTPESRW